jgi:hypothetical protein
MNIQSIKDFVKKMQELGFPLIWLRCPVLKQPSVSLSILILSVILHVSGIVGLKVVNLDVSFNFFMAAAALYWGRKLTVNGKTSNSEKSE